MTTNTPLGKAVKGACDELDTLGDLVSCPPALCRLCPAPWVRCACSWPGSGWCGTEVQTLPGVAATATASDAARRGGPRRGLSSPLEAAWGLALPSCMRCSKARIGAPKVDCMDQLSHATPRRRHPSSPYLPSSPFLTTLTACERTHGQEWRHPPMCVSNLLPRPSRTVAHPRCRSGRRWRRLRTF